ncbi:hypothetical protein M427DRAFT_112786 [Gonapodya prolifera JEL478]|uniref:Acyl-CoA desaturase n=1 Tax=Gonapodya prolifera (strain JEL478) TaxID=1344416 RepID=A0A139ABC1_GONPJ|nr:hypothetical protein M427DRAFT_112786 [Gonapodya prolifera JEL478]|eukprot:KXS14122.1 hypothetical protein M427DRAFT_112786 [Gonapodya prolifera JEL478]
MADTTLDQRRGANVQHSYTQQQLLGTQEQVYSWSNVNWFHTILLTATLALAAYGIATTPLNWKTGVWSFVWYSCAGLGITAGYHRLWSHKSYSASTLYQTIFAFFGASAFQGSILWWSRKHRQHHRYTDTPKDPHSAKQGALWCHVGWMLVKQRRENRGVVDVRDLDGLWIVRWQHKYYLPIAVFGSFVFPMLVAGLGWGDWRGGLFYAGITRQVLLHHATFCVNSLAHLLGTQPFDDRLTPRNHFITALVTFGEGNHNFHHEFPNDYRNGVKWWEYDPTKWVIWAASLVGLTWGLKEFEEGEIRKGELTMVEKKIQEEKGMLDFGEPVEELPKWTFAEFKAHAPADQLLAIDGVVYTVKEFMHQHPGGANLLKFSIGHDVTYQFNGGVYFHNNAARNWLAKFRVAHIADPALEAASTSDSVMDDDEAWADVARGREVKAKSV